MRENIGLYRGKTTVTEDSDEWQEWVEGYYYKAKYYRVDKELCDFITIPYPEENFKGSDHIMVMPESISEFTGLTDKNDTKIFEGDIVQVVYYSGKRGSCYVVEMSEERGGWFPFATDDGCGCCSYNVYSPGDVEIIGNITDNPELLGGEKG